MIEYNVWQGVDRRSFFKNAILLEIKNRCQGPSINSQSRRDSGVGIFRDDVQNGVQGARAFLDDLALLSSSDGGAANVSAVCMEIDDDSQVITLRVARNEGPDEKILGHLRCLISTVIENKTLGLQHP
jgi:hypothetical protein